MERGKTLSKIFKKWIAVYEHLPDALKQYLKRFRWLIYLIPLMGLIGLQSMGIKVTLLMILSLEGIVMISLYLTVKEFSEGKYSCYQGEIIKIEDQMAWMPFLKRKRVLYLKTDHASCLSVALRFSEAKDFSEGNRISVYAPGGQINRFGVIELWGYYSIRFIQGEQI